MDTQFYTPYEQDIPYGMSHNEPQPMGVMPAQQQGYPNLGMPFTNNNLNQMQSYAKGGHVSPNGLSSILEAVRRTGASKDKILAHISPEEAQELSMMHGGDINPITGLPQFGWWERLWEGSNGQGGILGGGHAVAEAVSPFARGLGTVLGAGMGGMLGGPLGAIAGGTLASGGIEGTTEERPRFGRALATGALTGGLVGFGGPMLGRAFGVAPASRVGTVLGMAPRYDLAGAVGLGSLLGGKGAGAAAGASKGRAAAYGALQKSTTPAAQGFGGKLMSGLGGIFGGGGTQTSGEGGGGLLGGGALSNALLGTAVLGSLMGKYETPKEKSMGEYMSETRPSWGPEHQPRELRPYDRSLRYFNPETYNPGFVPEMSYFSGPMYDQPARLAHGGHVYDGDESGQSDEIPTNLPNGSYIIDASSVSDAGDGNSEAGEKNILTGLHAIASKRTFKKGGNVPRGTIKALVSPKEMEIDPNLVTAIGHGNNDKGASTLKKMVNNLRKQKRSNAKSLPPKAKAFQRYARS